jgi:formylglycine-generating enzyme required for sulfatase activity
MRKAKVKGSGAVAQGKGNVASGQGGRSAGRDMVNIEIHQQAQSNDGAELRKAYLRSILRDCRPLSLAGVDPAVAASGDRGASLRLDAVYTALMTQSTAGGDGGRDISRGMDPQRLSALAQLDRHDRLVLLGDPGSGKSTFVSFVALCMAGEILKDRDANLKVLRSPLPDEEAEEEKPKLQPWRHRALVPVRVILRDLAAHGLPDPKEQITASHLWRFIEKTLADQQLGEYAPFLKNELLTKGGLVLLDGFDEVPDADRRREQIKEMVHAFSRGFAQCRILLTSRTYAYQKQQWRLSDFAEAVLAPWTDGQIQRFVSRWYDHAAALERLRAEDAEGRAALLRQAIFSNPRLLDLARRPLLLTLIASLHAWRQGSLPDGRAELYEDAVKLLLDFWEMARVRHKASGERILQQPSLTEFLRVDQKEVREVLEDLAFEAHEAQPDTMETADVDEGRLLTRLAELSREAAVNPVLLRDYLCDRAGLLIHRGVGVFTFPHRTFQEYLAACYLTRDEFPDRVASLAMEDPGRWREVLLLAGARAAGRVGSAVWNLADALCGPEAGEPGESSLSALWGAHLAGQAVAESAKLSNLSSTSLRRLDRLRKWLVHLLSDPRLSALERAQAGRVLAKLGDPRPEVMTAAEMAKRGLCRVEAGVFRMGSEEQDSVALDWEKPAHDINIPSDYRIGRYPVTVAQFRQFVEASGFEPGDPDCLRGPDNHPVVWVSWNEAVAFCEWMTALGHEEGWLEDGWGVRLPSEAEWGKAARGTEGRIYPWGPEPDPNRANYGETGIGGPSTVGCFPSGKSPYGCEEMSGNVWEWTLSQWASYAREERGNVNRSDSEERLRVVRGGAYFLSSRLVRCAYRARFDPVYRSPFIGFRVVAAPFSSGPTSAVLLGESRRIGDLSELFVTTPGGLPPWPAARF